MALGASQEDVEVTTPDALAFGAAREFEVAREHVARIARVAFERIGRGSSSAPIRASEGDSRQTSLDEALDANVFRM